FDFVPFPAFFLLCGAIEVRNVCERIGRRGGEAAVVVNRGQAMNPSSLPSSQEPRRLLESAHLLPSIFH
ncbi:unnamed protein product, partial [Linum tenue]